MTNPLGRSTCDDSTKIVTTRTPVPHTAPGVRSQHPLQHAIDWCAAWAKKHPKKASKKAKV